MSELCLCCAKIATLIGGSLVAYLQGASWTLESSPTTVQLNAVSFAGTQNIGQKVAFAVGDAVRSSEQPTAD